MRIRETHIWDHEKLILKDGGQEWMNQFLPWASVLWGRTIYKKDNSYILVSNAAPLKKPVLILSGFASDDNGLISVNASNDEAETKSAGDDSMIKIFKEDTLGRLLIGMDAVVKRWYIQGLRAEELIVLVLMRRIHHC